MNLNRGVLLDIDGTLVLSNDAHAHSWVAAFARHGYEVPLGQISPLIGMGGDKIIAALNLDLNPDSDVGKKISAYRTELFLDEYLPKLEPAPGARDLVEKLQQDGWRTIAASSAKEEELEGLLKVARLDDLLTEATTSSEVDNSKPSPDIVAVALKKLKLPASQALMIGDTPYDISAAKKCHVDTIAVRCGGFNDADLAQAKAIYDDPLDLLKNYAAWTQVS